MFSLYLIIQKLSQEKLLVHYFVDINECASVPCQNGGNCTDQVNGYNCSCVAGYTGIHCETGTYCMYSDV